jgi:predicted glycosyl hydrolase (DUF1957 family)
MEKNRIELGSFLVNCFTQLKNIDHICSHKLNPLVISEYISLSPDLKAPMQSVLITGKGDTYLEWEVENQEKAEARLAKPNEKEDMLNVLFSFYLSFPDEAQKKFNLKLIESFTNIAAQGL